MATSAIPVETIEVYRNAEYRFGQGADAVTLRIGTPCEALLRFYAATCHRCGAFITACNPMGQVQSAQANEAAQARLAEELKALANLFYEGVGADPAGTWSERSFFVPGIELEAAKMLGRRHRQNAFVWVGEGGVPELVLLR